MVTICIAGKNAIAVNALHYVLATKPESVNVVACVTRTDTGENSWQPSLLYTCKKFNVTVVSLEDCYIIENLIFFSLEFDRILRVNKFKSTKLFNIHFSFLPAYKGMYTSVLPLLHGEKYSGVTLHIIEAGIDTGPIVDQLSFEIEETTTARQLYDIFLKQSFILFEKNFDSILNDSFDAVPQSATGSTYYSASTLDFNKIEFNFNKTAWQVHNQFRAFTFRDYQLPSFSSQYIYSTCILSEPANAKPGNISNETEEYFDLDTIDYKIRLYKDKSDILFKAAELGDLDTIWLIHKAGYDISVKNKLGWDILIVACYNLHLEIVSWLLENGFNVNSTNYKGTSALMYAMTAASKTNELEVVKKLIKYGADFTHTDDRNLNVFDYASIYGNNNVVKFFNKIK